MTHESAHPTPSGIDTWIDTFAPRARAGIRARRATTTKPDGTP